MNNPKPFATSSHRPMRQEVFDAQDKISRHARTLYLTAGAFCAAILTLFFISRIGGDDSIEIPAATVQAVSVITVEVRTFRTSVSLSGEVRPVRDIRVAAPAAGVRILEILVDEGDVVSEGQKMARLDTGLAEAQTRAAEAAVAEAEAAASRARRQYERARALRSSGSISADAAEQRGAEAAAADARLAAARAQLAEVNARLGGGYVRAPAAGLVIDRMAELGRPVDGQVLFRIAVDNRLEVSAQVAEADVLSLRGGQPATFFLVDGSAVEATLRRLPASIDSHTRTGEALFALEPDSRVRAGMYLRGHARSSPRDVIAVPQTSVLYQNGQAYVLAVDDTSRAHRVNVQLRARDGDWIEVAEGLSAGQRVAGSGAAFLHDGEEVRALETPAERIASRDVAGSRAASDPRAQE